MERLALDLIFIDQRGRLLFDQQLERIFNRQLAALRLARAHVLEQPLELAGHILHARRRHDLDVGRSSGYLNLDLLVVELPFTQLFTEQLAGGGAALFLIRLLTKIAPWPWQQDVEDALFGRLFGAKADLLFGLFAG